MSSITIPRGSYSKGKQVAEALAHQPDYKCLSREILIEVSDQFNISEMQLIKTPQDLSTLLEHDNQGLKRF